MTRRRHDPEPVAAYKLSKALRAAIAALQEIVDMPCAGDLWDGKAVRVYYPADEFMNPWHIARLALDGVKKELEQ